MRGKIRLLTNVDYPGTIMDIALTYDGLDRLTNVVDAIGTTKFNYTAAGQLLSEDRSSCMAHFTAACDESAGARRR